MKKIFFLFATFIFFSNVSFSQQTKVDSLLGALKSTTIDTTKVNIYNNLFLEYEFVDVEKANDYLMQGFELAKKINFSKGLARSYMFRGYFEEDKSNYAAALKYNQEALAIYTKLGDKDGIAGINNSIGSNYDKQGNYPEAIKYFFSTLKTYLEIGNKKGEANSYSNIGMIYLSQANFKEALKNINASLKISEQIGDKAGQATCYNNIGNIYATQGNYPEALKNYLTSQTLNEDIDNRYSSANTRMNIGLIHQISGKYDEAIKCYTKSLLFFEEIENKSGVAVCYGNMGEANIGLKNYTEAKKYLNKAIDLSKQIGNKECIKNAYIAFYQMDSITGNYKGAFENHKKFLLYRDSLNNEETKNQTLQSKMTFDFEKKEAIAKAEHKKELENQEAIAGEKSRKQKLIIAFVVIGLLAVLLFAIYVLRSLRRAKKQNEVIELQKVMVEEKQLQIIDSIKYARRIQRSLLPTEKYIEKNLNRMRNSGQ